jgi:hypothetical protein
MVVLFQTSKIFKPRPLSFLGKQIALQATLAFVESLSFPFHKNRLNFWLISLIIFFKGWKSLTKRLEDYKELRITTDVFQQKKFFEVQEPIRPEILSTRALQSEVDNLV